MWGSDMKTIHLASSMMLILAACSGGAGSSGGSGTNGATGDDGGSAAEGGATGTDDGGAAQSDDGGSPTAFGDGGGCTKGGAPGSVDPPDDMGIDANCDGADGVVGKDVYVDPTKGLDTNAGTPQAPLATLAAALMLATSRQGNVLIDGGTLQDDDLSATGDWAVYGGYGSTFLGAPHRSLTIFTPTATGVLVEGGNSVKLAHVTVQPQPPQAGMQPSAHCIRSNVASLALDDVAVQAPPAESGTSGANGSDGAAGSQGSVPGTTCSGVASPASVMGALSGESPDGVTQPGKLGSSPVAAAQAKAGYPGTDGADATATLVLAMNLVGGKVGTAGSSDGTPGYGGAAGGSGTWNQVNVIGGYGGNGGCPGGGAKPGTSGGSSVGVLVLSGQLHVTRSSIQAGLGGTGGDGGSGGAGGAGGPGAMPGTYPVQSLHIPAKCSSPDAMMLNCAAYGGEGGDGGAGGRGGGGAGGWSVGLLMSAGTTGSIDSVSTITVSKPGVGGVGNGGSRAPSGQAHAQFTMP